ncbi:MAG: hypothetical protein IJ828_10865 [Treponema sp.]|nr:hypothetical protein [Treponema sp.]
MKKQRQLIAVLAMVLLRTLFCFADEQIVMPKDIYVGDTAELRYAFQSQTDLFLIADPSRVHGDVILLDEKVTAFKDMESICLVKKAVLQRVGITYTIIITFVPWVTGEIAFPECNLNELCGNTSDAVPFMLSLSPVNVSSIVKRTESADEGTPIAPLLLPGTNYVLWALISALLVLLVLGGIFIAHFSVIAKKLEEFKKNIGFNRNAMLTKRRLSALKKKELSDIDFACTWQQIMRTYLEYRFGTSFSSVTARSFASVISSMTGDMLNMEQENAVLSLQGFLQRTDYIRYAGGSIDSLQLPAEEHRAEFMNGERENIIEVSISDVEGLEFREKEMKKYG